MVLSENFHLKSVHNQFSLVGAQLEYSLHTLSN